VKHNGPLLGPGRPAEDLPAAIREYRETHDLELATWPSAEAQVAALADDIAYNNHDIDDGLRAGLFRQQDLDHLPLVGGVFREVRAEFPAIGAERVTAEAVRRLIGLRVQDLLAETGARLQEAAPADAEAVRAAGRPLVAFSEEFARQEKALRSFLMEHMYRHYRVNRMMSKARRVVRELFALFLDEPEVLPQRWRERAGAARDAATARVVCDYIAGMTDAFALQEHRRLFAPDLWP
jgi:dGTPase